MASVQSSRGAKCARRGLPEDEAPEHVSSVGEQLIKQLACKQTNTSLSLEEQLKNEKEFEQGIGCVMIGEFAPGTSSLQEFKESQLKAERIREFEGRGLSRGEAEAEAAGWSGSKASPAAIAANQRHIRQQLADKPAARCEGSVSRWELELASSVKPNSVETRLYKFAMQNKPACTKREPVNHPIHSLIDMEHSLMQTTTADPQKAAKTVRRKRRQQLEASAEPSTVHFRAPEPHSSLWDCIEPPVVLARRPSAPARVATCQREALYTVRGGRIVPLNKSYAKECVDKGDNRRSEGGRAFVALELPSQVSSISGRLTELEIKQLPRFENYERGTVSKVLYIKNLSSSVTENDLVAVFAKFQKENDEKIVFRLMNGKMRGQAFVTFKNCQEATAALEEVNGTILHGKPLVIQYGRHNT